MDDAKTKPSYGRVGAAPGPFSLFFSFVALALAGCVSTPSAPDTSGAHPANPQAAQSDYPMPQAWLLNITNKVEVKSATEPGPEHEGHDIKPKAEEKK